MFTSTLSVVYLFGYDKEQFSEFLVANYKELPQ